MAPTASRPSCSTATSTSSRPRRSTSGSRTRSSSRSAANGPTRGESPTTRVRSGCCSRRRGSSAPTKEELAAWAKLAPGAEELAGQGARPLDAAAADEFYVRTWAEPSADVNGILGGKPGLRNTTLSVSASGEFTIRLAPGQDVETIGAAAEQLLRAAAPQGAEVEIRWEGSPPGLVRPDVPAVQLALDAFERAIGV